MNIDTSAWHLAQINVGRLVARQGDPRTADFFAALDQINALAFKSRFPAPDQAGAPIDMKPDPWCAGRA